MPSQTQRITNKQLKNMDQVLMRTKLREFEKKSDDPDFVNDTCNDVYDAIEDTENNIEDKNSFIKGCASTIKRLF